MNRWNRLVDRIGAERIVDLCECIASVTLAILLARAIGAANISWAAVAGYMVMRGTVGETLLRGTLRIAGTVAGGLLALLLAPLAFSGPFSAPSATALLLLLVGTLSLYTAMTARRSYAWLFFGLTFAMAILDHVGNPAIPIRSFVQTRVLETAAGTVACIFVSAVSARSLRRRWPGTPAVSERGQGWRPEAFRHALECGVALAILCLLTFRFGWPGPAQAAITIMAVMMIPVNKVGRSGLIPVSTRLLHRLIGCVAGAGFAGLFLLAGHDSAAVLLPATLLGVALGRLVENGVPQWRYAGIQFTIAVLVTLVPDDYAHAAATPAVERLAGILIGMAILVPVLLLSWLASKRRRGAG